jgi:hypothetical protein
MTLHALLIWVIYHERLALSSAPGCATLSVSPRLAWENDCDLLSYAGACTSNNMEAMVFSDTRHNGGVLKTPDTAPRNDSVCSSSRGIVGTHNKTARAA